eukprot:TRINITY_DN46398_c0_g1_i1.p1 TRINITY_DN46398_c0_g1~~TRINITY_DN46398_c0_g1_i1.p1  ORF type:complete len:334 (-),score=26.65 TRINITY_DN46398_c0_g1_i1:140-1141(-)
MLGCPFVVLLLIAYVDGFGRDRGDTSQAARFICMAMDGGPSELFLDSTLAEKAKTRPFPRLMTLTDCLCGSPWAQIRVLPKHKMGNETWDCELFEPHYVAKPHTFNFTCPTDPPTWEVVQASVQYSPCHMSNSTLWHGSDGIYLQNAYLVVSNPDVCGENSTFELIVGFPCWDLKFTEGRVDQVDQAVARLPVGSNITVSNCTACDVAECPIDFNGKYCVTKEDNEDKRNQTYYDHCTFSCKNILAEQYWCNCTRQRWVFSARVPEDRAIAPILANEQGILYKKKKKKKKPEDEEWFRVLPQGAAEEGGARRLAVGVLLGLALVVLHLFWQPQ